MTRKVQKQSQSITECPLYGISPVLLADTFAMEVRQAARWKAQLRRRPDDARRRVQLLVDRDLGAFDLGWRGFRVVADQLYTPDGYAVSPSEVRAVPFFHSQLAAERAAYRAAERRLAEVSSFTDRSRQDLEVLLLGALDLVRRR